MIIQAGFDLETLARPLVVQEGKILPKLVLIGLDAEMQLDRMGVISKSFAGSLEPFHDEIFERLHNGVIKFFAIAHGGIWAEEYCFEHQPIIMEGKRLAKAAAARGFRMIGHFGLDETGYRSAGPQSYFDQYHRDLPPTMTHWVHSKLGRCR